MVDNADWFAAAVGRVEECAACSCGWSGSLLKFPVSMRTSPVWVRTLADSFRTASLPGPSLLKPVASRPDTADLESASALIALRANDVGVSCLSSS
jgi:hypothetical protein